jgi:hypothetical protein
VVKGGEGAEKEWQNGGGVERMVKEGGAEEGG